MTTPIVMLVGPGRSGKDTAGAAIAKELNGVCVALADPIKRAVRHPFNFRAAQLWGDEKEKTVRIERPWPEDLMHSLSKALAGWRSPAELSKFDFARWVRNLPFDTTPRHVMQTFGTECVREVAPDFWLWHGLWTCNKLLGGGYSYDREKGLTVNDKASYDVVCITDGRFRNEVLGVKRKGGTVLEVWRPEVQHNFSSAAKAHRSETEQGSIPRWWFDGRLENDDTLEAFETTAVSLASQLLGA